MKLREPELRRHLAEICHRMYRQGYIAAGDGNVSAKLDGERVLLPFMRQTNAMVMDRHGAITLGRDLDEAYNRLEAMEHAAKITHAARVLGPVAPLPPHEVDKLQDLARRLGIPRAPDPCTLCNACPNGTGGPLTSAITGPSVCAPTGAGDDALIDAVV